MAAAIAFKERRIPSRCPFSVMSSAVACRAVVKRRWETSLIVSNSKRLTHSLPLTRPRGLPVYVAASQAAPFLDFATLRSE